MPRTHTARESARACVCVCVPLPPGSRYSPALRMHLGAEGSITLLRHSHAPSHPPSLSPRPHELAPPPTLLLVVRAPLLASACVCAAPVTKTCCLTFNCRPPMRRWTSSSLTLCLRMAWHPSLTCDASQHLSLRLPLCKSILKPPSEY